MCSCAGLGSKSKSLSRASSTSFAARSSDTGTRCKRSVIPEIAMGFCASLALMSARSASAAASRSRRCSMNVLPSNSLIVLVSSSS